VLVTHFDVDHVGGLDRLAGLDVAVHAGQGDAALVAGRESPPLLSRKGALQRALGVFRSNPRVEVAPLADGETVGGFTVYETPGHTPGHVVYVNERVEAAFLGDLVRETDGRLEPSPWVLSDDVDRVRESVRELSERAPPFEMAAMGHGVPFERDGKDRLDELAATL
jgi:glyoxylase-like metal-dependent hydrolase (beta-lactamase superfamily II)